jgi:hypothetical protein
MKVKYPMGPHLARRWALWQWMDIPSTEHPDLVYLRRLRVVQTPWFSVLVHWINEPDTGRYPHDHPWPFCSFVLRGNYHEEVWLNAKHFYRDGAKPRQLTHRRWSIHKMGLDAAHRIMQVSPRLVTLVLTGKRHYKFNFWTPIGKIPYDKMIPAEVNDVE